MIPHCAFHLYFSIHHCGFDLYFPNSWWWLVSFPVFTDHLFVVFGEKNLDPFLIFKKLGCLCIYWIVRILHILHTDFFLFVYLFFICSEFCHTLKWNSHGFTCVPHPDPPSHLPLHLLPLGLPSAPGPSACLMHPAWAGDLFHPR